MKHCFWMPLAFGLLVVIGGLALAADDVRPRARDLGIKPGILSPGPLNAITDVPEVRVGHVTVIEGQGVRTGVTAVIPHTPFRLSGSAGRIEDIERVGGLDGRTLGRPCTSCERCPIDVAIGYKFCVELRPLQDHAEFGLVVGQFQRLVQ